VTAILVLLVVACFAVAMHAVTGFGSALLLSPALLAFHSPHVAVATMAIVGLAVNGLIAFRGPRRGLVAIAPVLRLVPGAVVGLPLGVLLLAAVAKPALQVLIGVVVLAAAVPAARRASRAPAPPREGRAVEAACGVVSGVLTSSTGIGVAPIALWLGRRVPDPVALRYGIAVYSVALTLGTAVLLLVTGGASFALGAILALELAPAIVLGHWLGRRAFLRLASAQFRAAMLALIVASAAASIAGGLLG
jgi:uncharacterized membrane protein YfcA